MKHLFFVILLSLSASIAAQTPAGTADVLVLETKWNVNSSRAISTTLNTDPFEPMQETRQLLNDQRENLRQNVLREKLGRPQEAPPVQIKAPIVGPAQVGGYSHYTYQAKLRNDGTREIVSIQWEYVFVDKETEQEVGRLALTSDSKIKPNETKTLTVVSTIPPTAAVKVENLGKDERKRLREKVEIKKIVYSDGTIWTAPVK